MPCKERVKFVSDGVSSLFDSPKVLGPAALVWVVCASGLAVGPVDGLEVSAWKQAEGVEVPREV